MKSDDAFLDVWVDCHRYTRDEKGRWWTRYGKEKEKFGRVVDEEYPDGRWRLHALEQIAGLVDSLKQYESTMQRLHGGAAVCKTVSEQE